MDSSVIGDLAGRYLELQELKRKVDRELVAVERGLRVAGLLSFRGKPPIAPTHTVSEAREAHRRHGRGERTEWVINGERQYQRERKQAKKRDRNALAAALGVVEDGAA